MSTDCSHENAIRDVRPSARGCEECLKTGSKWVHLRLCRTCGHVGCLMTRRIATLPSISMRPDTRSSKATIRQKDGDGAISTRSFWTYPTAPRLSSVQFRAIIDDVPNP